MSTAIGISAKDNEGLDDNDTSTSVPGWPVHLVENCSFKSYCD